MGPYIEQVKCVNRCSSATVREILQESPRCRPIILLQGDHGTKLLDATGYPRRERSPARRRAGAVRRVRRVLSAGRWRQAAFGDTVTVVNVLGNVLRHYFRRGPAAGGRRAVHLSGELPYEFRRVDARWLAGDDSAGTALRAGR